MRTQFAYPALGITGCIGVIRNAVADDFHQLLLLRVREWPQQNGIDKGIDDRICTDAESECEHRRYGKAWRAAHLAHGKADILQEAFDRRQRSAVTKGLAGLLRASESKHSLSVRFFLAESGAHRIVRIHCDMALKLSVEFDCFSADENSAQSQPESP
jgi:hypothetical protein